MHRDRRVSQDQVRLDGAGGSLILVGGSPAHEKGLELDDL